MQYEHLIGVTKNFTNSATRINYAELKPIIAEETIVYSKSFYNNSSSLWIDAFFESQVN